MNQWATAPLLDQANVGKDVWVIWNSNRKQAVRETIVKVTRTNIHTGGGASCRVRDTGSTGWGTKNGYGIYCETETWRDELFERDHLTSRIRGAGWAELPLNVLREVAALVGIEAAS